MWILFIISYAAEIEKYFEHEQFAWLIINYWKTRNSKSDFKSVVQYLTTRKTPSHEDTKQSAQGSCNHFLQLSLRAVPYTRRFEDFEVKFARTFAGFYGQRSMKSWTPESNNTNNPLWHSVSQS